MFAPRPHLVFEVPVSEVRGAYYALTTSGPVRATDVELGGKIWTSVDCDGCEHGLANGGECGTPGLHLFEVTDAAVLQLAATPYECDV